MKNTLFIISFVLLFGVAKAQSIHDSIFNNVILIQSSDIATDGLDFLIDIPIKPQREPIIIFNSDGQIPAKLFFDRKSFLASQDEFILITPDWEYYKAVAQSAPPGGCAEPIRTNKIYHIIRNLSDYKIDSLSINDSEKSITLNFQKQKLEENDIKCYYIDCYGSSCCPRDRKWGLSNNIRKKQDSLDAQFQGNIYKGIYKKITGKEGEHCTYYTFPDLSKKQKLQAIKEMKRVIEEIMNRSKNNFPKIYLPEIFIKNGLD